MSRGYRFAVAATIWLFAIVVHYIGTAMFGPSGALSGARAASHRLRHHRSRLPRTTVPHLRTVHATPLGGLRDGVAVRERIRITDRDSTEAPMTIRNIEELVEDEQSRSPSTQRRLADVVDVTLRGRSE